MRNTGSPYREGRAIEVPHTKTRPDLVFDFNWPTKQEEDVSFVGPMEEIHDAREKMFELGWIERRGENSPTTSLAANLSRWCSRKKSRRGGWCAQKL